MKIRLFYMMMVFILSITFPLGAATQTQEGSDLVDVSLTPSDTQIEVALKFSGPITYESFALFSPNRLILDLFGVENFSNDPQIDIGRMGIKSFRTAKNQADVTRFIIDFEDIIHPYSIRQSGNDIIIVLTPEADLPPQKMEAEQIVEEKPVTQPETEQKTEKTEEPEKEKVKKKPQPKELPQQEEKPESIKGEKKSKLAFGLTGGLYLLNSQDYKDVYGNSALYAGIEVDYYFHMSPQDTIGLALSFHYTQEKGKTTLTEEDVKLTLMPFSFGMIYQRNLGSFMPFVALGADYVNYEEALPDTYPMDSIKGYLWGFHFQVGTHFQLAKFLHLKAYLEYLHARRIKDDSLIDLSGLKPSLGVFFVF